MSGQIPCVLIALARIGGVLFMGYQAVNTYPPENPTGTIGWGVFGLMALILRGGLVTALVESMANED